MTKAIPNVYAGDESRWFVGTVVNHLPPRGYEGRVQIRIRGIHPEKTDAVRQIDLPWAQVLLPGTEEGSSGLGRSPRITTGATVFGYFLDGKQSQVPIVIGSFAKTENTTPIQSKRKVGRGEFTQRVTSSAGTFSYVDSIEELYAELKAVKRDVTEVVVHWTETYANKDIGAEDIDIMSGGIGYHYVIRRDGTLQRGLPVNEEGYHTPITSHNTRSIGIVFVGGLAVPSGMPNAPSYADVRSLTRSQMNTFYHFMSAYFRVYPGGQAIGGRDLSAETMGPGFDVINYVSDVFGKGTLFDVSSGFIERAPFTTGELNVSSLVTKRSYKASVSTDAKIAGVLNFIAQYESAGDYTAMFPNDKNPAVLYMTINEVLAFQAVRSQSFRSNAIGRYQFISVTLGEIAQRKGYDFDKVKYNQVTQDALCVQLLNDRADFQKWLNGQISDVQFLEKLSRIWAAIPDPASDESYYKNVGTNKALVTKAEALSELQSIRTGS